MKQHPFIHLLPCLRCGCHSVVVGLICGPVRREVINCGVPDCDTPHLLEITKIEEGHQATYQHYLLRHDISMYDNGVEMPSIRFVNTRDASGKRVFKHPEGFSGPLLLSKRRRFSKKDKAEIWNSSDGKCHLCGKKWKLNEHGRYGWHVDHFIPNIGGGDTENLSNMRVSCAKCNLSKGQGHTPRTIREELEGLLKRFKPRVS